jgi:hypothetical protein
MREAIELCEEPPPGAAQFLLEASEFERDVERDVLAAERHLAVALRVAPRDARIADRYRVVAAEAAEVARALKRES